MPLATLLLLTTMVQDQAMVEYRDPKLGLTFQYPKTWKVRRDRYSAVFEIPLDEARTAVVQVFNASYKDTAEKWQLVQQEINRSMKRAVDRQWTEEYLGVPMLLTKTSYVETDKNVVGIVGLLYSSYVEKMQFRLTSPVEGAEQAEGSWRNVLLTLRTVTGELPATEDPTKNSVVPVPPTPTTIWKPTDHPKKTVRGPDSGELTVETTKFKFSLPKGWTIEGTKLVNKSVSGQLTVTAKIGLPEEAGATLLDGAKTALGEFKEVKLREDPRPDAVLSGAVVGRIFRIGTGNEGPLVIGTAVAYCEGVYWAFTYRATDFKTYERDKAALNELYRLMYAERA